MFIARDGGDRGVEPAGVLTWLQTGRERQFRAEAITLSIRGSEGTTEQVLYSPEHTVGQLLTG
jgi:hypothetical protein